MCPCVTFANNRLSAPSPAAGRPRYSLVWKLVMLPKQPGSSCSLARPEWGPPTYFGSAAHVRAAAAAAAAAKSVPRATAGAEVTVAEGARGAKLDSMRQQGVGQKRPATEEKGE